MIGFRKITEDNFAAIIQMKRPDGENLWHQMPILWRKHGFTGRLAMSILSQFITRRRRLVL